MQKKIGKALVVGAGISGIRSALDLAEGGYGVTLVDQAPHLGGILSMLDRQFPTNRCGMCKMLPLVERDRGSQFCLRKGLFHDNIEIRTATRVTAVEGEPGHMKIKLRRTAAWVDAQRCMGCGACAQVCPVEVPDAFNSGLSMRKAVYHPVPHNFPNTYVIDPTACTRCGECEKACPTGAIDLSQDERRQFHILVVDDELVVRDSLKEWLVDEGYTVDMADSGGQALEKLADRSFHLMLTDIKMPGMDGVELLKRATELRPELTVVMMTAYATVETAVDAMKIGALDYLMKPFNPEKMLPLVAGVYADMVAGRDEELEVGAVVLAGGIDYYPPSQGLNPYDYGTCPHVLTQLEFERLLSGTGPTQGKLIHPANQKPIENIAFLQCVGSRDLQAGADFCSTACCLISVKQALLAKEMGGAHIDTAIFYMDMRAFGLPFQRFCDDAREIHKVRFERGRIHSLWAESADRGPILRHVNLDGHIVEERFDLVVLATGQRPKPKTAELAETMGLSLNPWGFLRPEPFSPVSSGRPGILLAGSCTGLKDISASVIDASAAASEASRTLHRAGMGVHVEIAAPEVFQDVSAQTPRTLVAICPCGNALAEMVSLENLEKRLRRESSVAEVVYADQLCSTDGWEAFAETARKTNPNRILIGTCHGYAFAGKLRSLAETLGLHPRLAETADLGFSSRQGSAPWTDLSAALLRLKHISPLSEDKLPVVQEALVVGGGIAGMQAALCIAGHGRTVHLIEKRGQLGGNLAWLNKTLDGHDIQQLLSATVARVEKHPLIHLHLRTQVLSAFGQVGRFFTTIDSRDQPPQLIEHGVVVLATGANEAETRAYQHGSLEGVMTQKALEAGLADKTIDPANLQSVVMILCVESRLEPRNYCSRVCCPTALKHALHIKSQNPDTRVYILYRDMMTCGFDEQYFTQARQAGVTFVAYTPGREPVVDKGADSAMAVRVYDPIVSAPLEIAADLVVLATGMQPELPARLAQTYGAELDQDGFFKPADFKWRPVDALAQGVFACGTAHAPRNITETIATAQAAGQRAMTILSHTSILPDRITAKVRHSLCSLCERCIAACPYTARCLNAEGDRLLVNPVICQGCGACAAACPNSAAIVEGFTERQMLETIDAALDFDNAAENTP